MHGSYLQLPGEKQLVIERKKNVICFHVFTNTHDFLNLTNQTPSRSGVKYIILKLDISW